MICQQRMLKCEAAYVWRTDLQEYSSYVALVNGWLALSARVGLWLMFGPAKLHGFTSCVKPANVFRTTSAQTLGWLMPG